MFMHSVKVVITQKGARYRRYYGPLIGSDIMAYLIAPVQMTLNNLQGDSPIARLFR